MVVGDWVAAGCLILGVSFRDALPLMSVAELWLRSYP